MKGRTNKKNSNKSRAAAHYAIRQNTEEPLKHNTPPLQKVEIEEEETILQGKFKKKSADTKPQKRNFLAQLPIVQKRAATEEDETLQGKFQKKITDGEVKPINFLTQFNTLQKQIIPEENSVEGQHKEKLTEKSKSTPNFLTQQHTLQKKENNTGLPDNLKAGMEHLSGYSMDDVKVHYNSDKPTRFNAHAYAQGADIHLATGQEKHLPHEAWHVVQQKQGRVRPTLQMKGGVNVNDDKRLEEEADKMGKEVVLYSSEFNREATGESKWNSGLTIQKKNTDLLGRISKGKLQEAIPASQAKEAIQLVPRNLTRVEARIANIAKLRAIRMLENAQNRGGRTLAQITARFPGITTNQQRSEIHRRLEKIRMSIINIYAWRNDPTAAGVFAYVDPRDETLCYLGPAFFGAVLAGVDSRAGTIIHEVSHYNKALGTQDLAYGVMADTLPFEQFKRNADSLEHFAEWY